MNAPSNKSNSPNSLTNIFALKKVKTLKNFKKENPPFLQILQPINPIEFFKQSQIQKSKIFNRTITISLKQPLIQIKRTTNSKMQQQNRIFLFPEPLKIIQKRTPKSTKVKNHNFTVVKPIKQKAWERERERERETWERCGSREALAEHRRE